MSIPVANRDAVEATDQRIAFILRMARAMHQCGYASQRLEESLVAAAQRLDLEAQFFSTPTSIFASFGPETEQRTYLLRVQPGATDLGKLAQVDAVTLRVIRGELTPAAGADALTRILDARPAVGPALMTLAYGFTSAGAARFFGGGTNEIAVAGTIGIASGLLAIVTRRIERTQRLFEPTAAFLAAVIATVAAQFAPVAVMVSIMAGLISLVPGLTLTVAMSELATRHLVAGTARLASAMLLFLSIIFGVALGRQLTALVVGEPPSVEPTPLPFWTEGVALLAAPVGFGLLLRAEARDFLHIALAGWLAYTAARLASTVLGPELGAFVGAFAVGMASNVFAVLRDRPTHITLAPGTLLLVPGSFGFMSAAALLEREVISGVDTAFKMAFIATALVSGLLAANVIGPRRKSE
jgi:uncharacterized membrane protein YjjP (DUF1212 family)